MKLIRPTGTALALTLLLGVLTGCGSGTDTATDERVAAAERKAERAERRADDAEKQVESAERSKDETEGVESDADRSEREARDTKTAAEAEAAAETKAAADLERAAQEVEAANVRSDAPVVIGLQVDFAEGKQNIRLDAVDIGQTMVDGLNRRRMVIDRKNWRVVAQCDLMVGDTLKVGVIKADEFTAISGAEAGGPIADNKFKSALDCPA